MDSSNSHDAKHQFPKLVTVDGIVNLVNEQPEKQYAPMFVTEFGMAIAMREEQPSKQ